MQIPEEGGERGRTRERERVREREGERQRERQSERERERAHLSWTAPGSSPASPREGSAPSSDIPLNAGGDGEWDDPANLPKACMAGERIFIERMTSDRKLEASGEGSKCRNYGT